MARPLRMLTADGWYYVFHRGTERRVIYLDDRDREHFLELLGQLPERYRFVICAYALMDTHWLCGVGISFSPVSSRFRSSVASLLHIIPVLWHGELVRIRDGQSIGFAYSHWVSAANGITGR